MNKPLLTITELARRSGISSRTIRFWSDEGLIPVSERSAARYRLYDEQAVARLDLVHTLRELGLGLPAITAILRRQQTLVQVASTHVEVLEARIRDLRMQRAVLRVLVRRGGNPEETKLMQKLVHNSAVERQRLIDSFVARVFEGIEDGARGAHIGRAMRELPAELPDDPSDVQVDAWLELATLVADESFAVRVREMVLAGVNGGSPMSIDISGIREHAGAALAAQITPASTEAEAVIDKVLPASMSQDERVHVRKQLQTFSDARVERYWQLLAALHDRPAQPIMAPACDWFIAALLARES